MPLVTTKISVLCLLVSPCLLAGPALAADLPIASAGASPFEDASHPARGNSIDDLVFGRLQKLGIQPANSCSDAVFVRRAFLDVIGVLPAGYEARQFILDGGPNKRAALIDHLLEREEFADYWAMKWGDLLRIKSEFPINLWPNAAQAYHHWVRECIKKNLPYDEFVRELLTASGSNFDEPPVNFYRAMQNRAPMGMAQTVALTFMGTRAENWPREELSGMAAFFSNVGFKSTGEWKEEIVFFNPASTNPGAIALTAGAAAFPDGATVKLTPDKDPRKVFADWLIDPKNPWFTRNIANRVWYWLLGRGMIQEPDDIRPENPPSNPELLNLLQKELVGSRYDLKRLYRLILNSKTYQLSSIPGTGTPEAAANFAYYPLRRLDAEVLIDAVDGITTTTEKYTSAIPEPYTFIPEDQRSIALPDGSITSSFLDMFGRPPRDTGLESERNNRISADQELHLLNSSHILRKIEQSQMVRYQMQSAKNPRQIATGIYLGILSRFPTEDELRTVEAHYQTPGLAKRAATVDLAWALLNSAEFLYRH